MHKFNEHNALHELKHYLPAQAPLKDFIHHNTLHVFQTKKFYDALHEAAEIFGFKTTLSLNDYRKMYADKRIKKEVMERVICERKGATNLDIWKEKLLNTYYEYQSQARIGKLKQNWKSEYKIDLDTLVHPTLFRIVCSYLDQGISIWNFPVDHKGFLSSIKELERVSYSSFFKNKRAKELLLGKHCNLVTLLDILVGDESLYEQYLFDQQFAHQGWSGIISVIEDNPNALIDAKKITLHDFIVFELLMEIDALDSVHGKDWKPLHASIKSTPLPLFAQLDYSELADVISLWQDSFEWSYYDEVLAGIQTPKTESIKYASKNFQAMFCIDDRECSIRRYVEKYDPTAETFGTPGFFGVEFYFQPKDGKFHTKLCPAPVTPKYLIKETNIEGLKNKDAHFSKRTHSLLTGWLISQTLGFWAAARLAINIFRPSMSPATSTSFKHMNKNAQLTIENVVTNEKDGDLQIGFTVDEMATRVENLLKSIGLVNDFAPLVYIIGHGASSVNNTHYAGYDCGACSGRPGSVNARVMSHMANHTKVRELLKDRGLVIPNETQFVGALHDTTRDEIEFYDEIALSQKNNELHRKNLLTFSAALDDNAKERSRRFVLTETRKDATKVHESVKLRSVSLFEPRPELNHATNALCIVGRRDLTKSIFLDRRSFLNSYNYQIDPEGKLLYNILRPIGPVCGGINLEYYFSRVDNQKLGAGTKLPHNVMGLIGVANGIDGDLRPGLPSQMIEVHDPIRLMLIVEHYPEVLLKTIQQAPEVYEWYINEWIHITSVNPDTKELQLFKNGAFIPYTPLSANLIQVSELSKLVESTENNFPVYLLKN